MQEVVDAGLALLRALWFHGISQVEFKRDPRDGRFKLMEVNPRLWQWHGLAAACGVDLPLIAYRDLTGEQVEPVSKNGARRSAGRSRHARRAARSSSGRRTSTPSSRADDLKPGLVHAARVARGVFR